MVFELGELFCGPGGLALGAINAKIDNPEYKIIHKWATDYDKPTCDTWEAGKIMTKEAVQRSGLSRSTFYRRVHERWKEQ